jgi:hypothetical protein
MPSFFLLFHANNTQSIIFTHKTTSVFPFLPKTMHDLTCSQGFLKIQSLVQNKNHIGVCLNKQVLEIQVIFRKVTILRENLKKKEKKQKKKNKNTMK